MPKRIARGRRRARVPPNVSELVQLVPHLAPEMLHQLIVHRGLDVCADLVASATPTQLASVLDIDLWRSAQPGHDERFDTVRFGEWLELLVDASPAVAARTVAAMDEHLVVAGLSRYVRVFDPAAMVVTLDGEPLEVVDVTHTGPERVVGGYLVRGITTDAWDAIVALLVALDADHHDRFHAVMRQCRRLSNSTPEIDGLDDLLTEPEQLLHDVTLEREQRRAQQGYSTPADARAFLLMARGRRRASRDEPSVNPLVAAYFRAASDSTASGAAASPDGLDIVARAGLAPQRPRALLEGAHDQPSRFALVRRLVEHVRDNDDALYLARTHELAFLANTLVAGCSIQSRSFTPQEASDAAAGICNLGLEHWPARWSEPIAPSPADTSASPPETFLMDHDLVSAFEVGWVVLHEDVSMFAAGQLVLALSNLRCADADIQKGLNALRIALTRQRDAGTPWHARDALDVIAMLDIPAWASMMGLLDQCPVIPAALSATLDGRTGAVSATAFEFISTSRQLDRVREFMARFPEILRF